MGICICMGFVVTKARSMNHRESAFVAVTPKNLIGLSVLFLGVASILGLLNSHKVRTLHTNAAKAEAPRAAAEHRPVTQERNIDTGRITVTAGEDKLADATRRATKAEGELAQLQKEKADLENKLDAHHDGIASIRARM